MGHDDVITSPATAGIIDTATTPGPTWLVTIAEGAHGFWLGPGEPPPLRKLKPGEYADYALAPQIAILLHSVCVGDGWIPEVSVTGPGCETATSLKPAERLGDTSQRWELLSPIEVGPKSIMTQIKLRLVNRSVETRTERDAILMGMPHLMQRAAGDQREAIRAAMRVAEEKLIDAANRARFAGLHELADAVMGEAQAVNVLAAHKDVHSP